MTNSIQSHVSGLHVYRQQSAQPQQSTAEQASTAASKTTPDELSARAEANGISSDEQQMIEKYFPETEKTLRLYGPERSQQELNPGALGGRLDVRG